MKSLRLLAAAAVAGAVLFDRPSAAQKQNPAPTPDEQRRREVVLDYFAHSRAHARAEARLQAQDRRDPKWMDSMQQLLKDLADENAKLRTENESLRADSEALLSGW